MAYVVALTLVCLLALAALDAFRVAPVVLGLGEPTEPPRHAMPGFSSLGFVTWIFIVSLYSTGCVLAGRGAFAGLRGHMAGIAVVLLTTTSLGFLLVMNPYFLPLILSHDAWMKAAKVIERIPVLNQIYFHWGLPRFWYVVFVVQAAIALGILALFGKGSSGAART